MKNQRQHKILVVDDDPGIVDILSLMLRDEGYEVDIASEPASINQMHSNLPDLILLDIWMSGTNGSEICRNLKTKKSTKHIPIIMISANRDTEDIAKEAGADDFIVKPFEMSTLLEKVKNLLS
jgi:DNA-binding response OmpR family regulator